MNKSGLFDSIPGLDTGANPADKTASSIALGWLVRLRWWMIASQAFLILSITVLFQIQVSVLLLGGIIIFQVCGNLFLHYREYLNLGIGKTLFILVIFLDVLLFTLLLYVTGGPMNPFTFLYLFPVALGAILLWPYWSVALAGFTSLAYALLFFMPPYSPPAGEESALDTILSPCHMDTREAWLLGGGTSPHLQGMWVGFVITAFFMVFFIGQMHKALQRHRQTINDLREQKLNSEKMASLATLAAGAAHELSTPLATIAVAGNEMRHTLQNQTGKSPGLQNPEHARREHEELLEDLDLICGQVQRCKEVLYQMSADVGEHLGEELADFTVQEVVNQALGGFSPQERDRVMVDHALPELMVRIPQRTLSRVLRGLIKNALDASAPDQKVTLSIQNDDRYLLFKVRDQGTGMDEDTLKRAAEPFFTTKEPGRGLGLGLFLARSAAERLGGALHINSRKNRGTEVCLSFALDMIRVRGKTSKSPDTGPADNMD